jgi:hydroxymethylbilane synthase
MNRTFVIGSRGSDLALWQANFVKDALVNKFPDHNFEIKIIRTTGDEVMDVALSKIGDKGLFTRQIESQLLSGSIDIAVHSLKDLQTEQPDGLTIGAVCLREMPNDILISKNGKIDDLPQGAKVATGSLRRRSQLLNYRPDLEIVEIRGNVPTRLRKFDESDLDAMVLAYAGLHRLGFGERISQLIPFDIMLPAVGQGAVAVEVRDPDHEVLDVIASLNHRETRIAITAERAFLRRLEGGCQVPIGAYAALHEDELTLTGVVGSLDGKVMFRQTTSGELDEAETLGTQLAEDLIDNGAADLLNAVRDEVENRTEAAM